jgi:hypothetical protein
MAIIDMVPWLGRDRWTITPMWMSEERTAVEVSLLRILALAQREKLAPGSLVELFADEHWGMARWRFMSIASLIKPQTPLAQSLIAGGLASDDHAIVCLRIAEFIPNPLVAWDESINWKRPMNGESVRLWRNQIFYWTIVALILLHLLGGFWYFCGMPLRRVLVEFGLGDYAHNIGWMPIASLQIASILAVALLIYWVVQSARWMSTVPLHGTSVNWRPWGFAIRRRECLRQMSLCLRGGIADDKMVETLLKCNPNPRIRKKLNKSLSRINTGVPVWKSLSDTRLLTRRQALALQRCVSPEVQSWVLQQITLNERESSFFARMARGVWVQPALTFAFGAVVLLTGYVLIGSLNEMIRVFAERHG